MTYILNTAFQLGSVYTLVALALFLSYRTLNIADMTTDGSYVLGMAVSVSLCASGHPFLGILCAFLAGNLAGFVTAMLQVSMGVPSILAGIITCTGLYTVNLAAMGWSANKSLLKVDTIFTIIEDLGFAEDYSSLIVVIVIAVVLMILMRLFLSTRLGLSIRATGDNPEMVSSSSINPKLTITVGLVIANGLTAMCGGLMGQLNKSADINAGTGIVVIGLASLIIGETLVGAHRSLTRNIIACFVGNIVYRMIYAIVLQTRIIPIEGLKLMTACIVAIAIAFPYLKARISLYQKMRKESKYRC